MNLSSRLNALNAFNKKKKKPMFGRRNNMINIDQTPMNTPVQLENTQSGNVVVKEISQPSTQKVFVVNQSSGVPSAAARFNIVITRNSVNIAQTLPVALFGVQDYDSDYAEVLANYLPAGVTVAVARTADSRGIRFTYTSGMDVDTIDVTLRERPYTSLLRGSQNSLIKLSQIKAKIADAANESQFSQLMIPFINTLFGRSTYDKFTPDDFLRGDQYVQTMRTINQDIDLDPETSLVVMMEDLASNELVLTTTVAKFETKRAVNF